MSRNADLSADERADVRDDERADERAESACATGRRRLLSEAARRRLRRVPPD
jgi:hypothetical protein